MDIIWIVIFTVVYLIPLTGQADDPRAPDRRITYPAPRVYVKIAVLPGGPHRRRGRPVLPRRTGVGWDGSIPLPAHPLAFLKFVIVIGWYMHLRYEKATLSRFFAFGFVLAFTLYAIVLVVFGVLALTIG